MIAIEVNGGFLDLGDASIRYELVNPMFSNDVYQGDFSFPGTAPATPHNLALFGFANSLDIANRVIDYTAQLYVFGLPKFKVKLRITKGRRNSFDFTMKGGIKALENSDKKLSEIDLGGDFDLGNNQATILAKAKEATESGDWSAFGFCFPAFYAPNFYNELNPDFNGVVNRVNSLTGDILGNPTSGTLENKYTLVPLLFQHYILSRIFAAEGLTPGGSYWEHPELKTLLLFNNRAIDIRPTTYETRVKVETTHNLTATGQKIDFNLGQVDTWDNGQNWDEGTNEYIIQRAGKHLINVYLRVETNNSGVIKPFNLEAGRLKLMIDGVSYDSKKFPVEESYVDEEWYLKREYVAAPADIGKSIWVEFVKSSEAFQGNTFVEIQQGTTMTVTFDNTTLPAIPNSTVKFANHVPDMTVGEFLAKLRGNGLVYEFDFDRSRVQLNIMDRLLEKNDAIDLSGKAEAPYELSMEESGDGVTLSYDFPAEENADLVVPPEHLIFETEEVESVYFPAPIEGKYVIQKQTGEVYMAEKDPASGLNGWVFKGYAHSPYVIGNGKTEVKNGLPPMLMVIAENELGTGIQNKAIMPRFDGIGSSDLYGLGINSFEPRQVFYRGYNENGYREVPYTCKYVVASTGNMGLNLNSMGTLKFRLNSAEGLMRATGERFYTALTLAEYVEKNFYLEARDFETLKNTSKIYCDYNRYLLKTMSTLLKRGGCRAKAVMLRI